MMNKGEKQYIPGLDGLRAFAVLAVIGYHLFPSVIKGGFIGVDIFFVISGFLITTLLINEHAKHGRIHLVRFWQRRARRLLPALITTVLVISSVALLVGGDVLVGLGGQVAGALTFSNNWVEIASGLDYFASADLHLFSNFWSLAVEEQFYAVWPFILVAILSIASPILRYKAGMYLAIIFSLISAGLMYFLLASDTTRVYYGSDTHAFGLMIGAAFAFWGRVRYVAALRRGDIWPSARFRLRRTAQVVGAVSFVALLALVIALPGSWSVTYSGGLYIASLLTGILIITVVGGGGRLQKVLEIPALKWIGVRSYGLYLWHWPILVLLHYGMPATTPAWIPALITLGVTVLIAAISYRYIENPIREQGIGPYLRRGFWRAAPGDSAQTPAQKLYPHPLVLACLVLIVFTVTAIVSAPSETLAQQQVRKGQDAIAKAQQESKKPAVKKPVTGSDITLIGDSVSLASAPALQAKFPGIHIDAIVSRSMNRGGLETIQRYLKTKQLRRIVVVAIGTNGPYGEGKIPELMRLVGSQREAIFVTAHAPVEWIDDNNRQLAAIKKRYKNMHIAQWHKVIAPHPELLGPDGIHPGQQGGALYAASVSWAVKGIQ